MNEVLDKNKDKVATITIFVASFIFYYMGCIKLLNLGFYEQINIAFDLDQSYYFNSLGEEAVSARLVLIKHPFIYLYHYGVAIFNQLGISEKKSIILFSQLFHSLSLVISYFVFRCMGRNKLESFFIIVGLSGTSTYISTGLVLDTYTIAIFWISVIYLIISLSIYQNIESSKWLRAVVSIMAIGTTSYLLILVILMEYSLAKKNRKVFNIDIFKQIARIIILGILLFIITYYQVFDSILQDPLSILKHVYWTVNRPGEKVDIFQVITVFSIFSIIAPKISIILLPEGIKMIDLRLIDFSYIGWVGVLILMLTIFLKANKNQNSQIFLISLVWLSFNVFFHTVYQYRGSLFLYSGNFLLSVWVLYLSPFKAPDTYSKKYFLYKRVENILIYIFPFIIWLNNIYLYQEIINII